MLNELAGKRFAKLGLAQWLWIVGVVLLITSALFWWFGVQTQPQRVFNDMLEQSMRTNGVTVSAQQSDQGSDVKYWLQYSLGGTNQARSLTEVNQNGSKVVTEVLGATDYDYTRYAEIETAQTDEQGNPIDVSSIENTWAKTAEAGNSLLAESALGLTLPLGALPVPVGSLSPENRATLMHFIDKKGVYNVDYSNVETKHTDGRLQYVYDVQIDMILYADLLKQFAKSVGLHNLDQLDPNDYAGSQPISLKMTVDVRSKHLTAVDVKVSDELTYNYSYGSYDVPVNNQIPQNTISEAELQQRVGELSANEQ